MNKKEKPKMNSPNDFRLLFPEKMRGRAKASNGRAKAAISTLNPNTEIIHAVTVVPMFAPIITLMDSASVNSPALTKLTTMTVVAEEDCTNAVINMPVSTPVTRLVVIAVRMLRSLSPATFCKPSLMIFIPYRKSPNEPMSFKKS